MSVKAKLSIIFLLICSVCIAQNKAKSAFKQLNKGDLDKANSILAEIESNGEQALPYYYVKGLYLLETAISREDFKSVLYFALKSDPRSLIDAKEIKNLEKRFDLDSNTYSQFLSDFYRRVFLSYKGINTAESWIDHNSVFAFSKEKDSAIYYEARSVFNELEGSIETYNSFYLKYANEAYTSGIALKAFKEKAYLEYKAASESLAADQLFEFALKYSDNSELKDQVKSAFAQGVTLEYEKAVDTNSSLAFLYFANRFDELGFDELVGQAKSKAFNLDFEYIQSKIKNGVLTVNEANNFLEVYRENGDACNLVRTSLDSLITFNLAVEFSVDEYGDYLKNFPETSKRGALDSLFNLHVYHMVMKGDALSAQALHKKYKRLDSSYGLELIQGLIDNILLTYIPALNEYDSYSFLKTEERYSKSLSGTDVASFSAEQILRDGFSFFRYKKADNWVIIQLDALGKIKELVTCDYAASLKNNLYVISNGDFWSVMNTNGDILISTSEKQPHILPNGKILLSGPKSIIMDPWSRSITEINHFVQADAGIVRGFLIAYNTSSQGIQTSIGLYSLDGKEILHGKNLKIEYLVDNVVNIVNDGKHYLLKGDSLFLSPVNKYVLIFHDKGNMIYGDGDDSESSGIYTIVKNDIKTQVKSSSPFVQDGVITFRSSQNQTEVYSSINLAKMPLSSFKEFIAVKGDVLVKTDFGFISLYKQNETNWSAPITLSTASGLYKYEEFEEGESGGEGYLDDPFDIGLFDYSSFTTAEGIDFTHTSENTPSLYPVLIDDKMEYVDESGKLLGPNYFNQAAKFDGPMAQAFRNDGFPVLVNSLGTAEIKGAIIKWVGPYQLIISDEGECFEYNTRFKQKQKICSDCEFSKKIASNLYEVKVDKKIAYVKTGRVGTSHFYGNYLTSDDYNFRKLVNSISEYWWKDRYRSFYHYENFLDEIKTPSMHTEYLIARLKFNLALSLDLSKLPVAIKNLESFEKGYFTDNHRIEVYDNAAYKYKMENDYQQAILYYGLISTIIPEFFNRLYAYTVATCYEGIKDYSNAEKYYEGWGLTLDEPRHYESIASMYKDAGYSVKAISYYKKYAAIGKEEKKSALDNLGHIYFNDGDYSSAMSFWKQCAPYYNDNDFKQGQLYYNIAVAYQNQGHETSACKYYRLAKLRGHDVPYWYNNNCSE